MRSCLETRFDVRLPFAGSINDGEFSTDEQGVVSVVSPRTFGMPCPIVNGNKHLWNGDEDAKTIARQYYPKPSMLVNALVINSPIAEEGVTNPVRLIAINKSLADLITTSLMNPDIETSPFDMEGGRDFVIRRRQQGQWANYAQSGFGFRERALTETERGLIEQHGLHDLVAELGPKPDAAAIEVIRALFADSFAGRPFDAEKYGPHGYRFYRSGDSKPVMAKPLSQPVSNSAGTLAALRNRISSKQVLESIEG